MKLSSGIGKVDTIIVNASECEPYITADERLLREQPDRVLRGLEVLMEILDQKQAVIGMEDNKPAAAVLWRRLCSATRESGSSFKSPVPQGLKNS